MSEARPAATFALIKSSSERHTDRGRRL